MAGAARAAACGSDSDCPRSLSGAPSRCLGDRCIECVRDTDCPFPSTCNANRCVARRCVRTEDCPGSSGCVQGQCQARNCRRATECADTEACSAYGTGGDLGKCLPLGGRCQRDLDCFGGSLVCAQGAGGAGVSGFGRCAQCNDDGLCPAGESCRGGRCTGDCTVVGCGPGKVCVGGRACCPREPQTEGVCGRACSATSPCSLGSCSRCVNGMCSCRPGDLDERCEREADCAAGLSCFRGRCAPAGAECALPQGDPTCSDARPFCVRGRCSPSALGLRCTTSSECAVGVRQLPSDSAGNVLYCVNGACGRDKARFGEQCGTDVDCSYGLRCLRSAPDGVRRCLTTDLTQLQLAGGVYEIPQDPAFQGFAPQLRRGPGVVEAPVESVRGRERITPALVRERRAPGLPRRRPAL